MKKDGLPSKNTLEDDAHIRKTVEEAPIALGASLPGIRIGCDQHYQLSNRIAFGWKLATLGIPTAIVYLGFLGDAGLSFGNRRPSTDDAD